jgi:hypothetical protein
MKQTLFIPLEFQASPITTAPVNVPFKVKTIHVKSAGYNAGTPGQLGYVCLIGSFAPSTPLAILNQDMTYSSNTMIDVEIDLRNPQVIQGTYEFKLLEMDGDLSFTSNAGLATDSIGLIVEFNSEDEKDFS